MDPSPAWSPLDNAGKLFPSIESDRATSYFRISVTFHRTVKRGLLQDALEAVIPRFPYFRVRAVAGFFWYTLVPEPSMPRVWPDSAFPCQSFQRRLRPPHLFRVRHQGPRVAVEFSHALTDGTGALEFLKCLASEYLAQSGISGEPCALVIDPRSEPDPRESEDAFLPLYQKGYPRAPSVGRAFKLPGRLSPLGVYHITTGILSLERVQVQARDLGVSLTEFLLAVLFSSLQSVLQTLAPSRQTRARPFRLQVPVNLRRIFPSPTMRNFFLTVPIEFDPRLGAYTLDELARKVHYLFRAQVDPKLILKQVVRNVRGEVHPLSRSLPLIFKNWFLQGAFRRAEATQTMSLSNLGPVELPDLLAAEIAGFDFIPPPSPHNRVNASVVSFGDRLSVTFGRQSDDSRLEHYFFTTLVKRGIPVKLETN